MGRVNWKKLFREEQQSREFVIKSHQEENAKWRQQSKEDAEKIAKLERTIREYNDTMLIKDAASRTLREHNERLQKELAQTHDREKTLVQASNMTIERFKRQTKSLRTIAESLFTWLLATSAPDSLDASPGTEKRAPWLRYVMPRVTVARDSSDDDSAWQMAWSDIAGKLDSDVIAKKENG